MAGEAVLDPSRQAALGVGGGAGGESVTTMSPTPIPPSGSAGDRTGGRQRRQDVPFESVLSAPGPLSSTEREKAGDPRVRRGVDHHARPLAADRQTADREAPEASEKRVERDRAAGVLARGTAMSVEGEPGEVTAVAVCRNAGDGVAGGPRSGGYGRGDTECAGHAGPRIAEQLAMAYTSPPGQVKAHRARGSAASCRGAAAR